MIRSSSRRLLCAAAGATYALTAGVAIQGAGCQQTATAVPVRSLERSGRVSFVCLGPPDQPGAPHPLEDCTNQQFTDINAFPSDQDAGADAGGFDALPHLYALVTQTTRGEVAVIDTNSLTRQVLDGNPIEPGANLLPIGALPTSIVSTPGGVATFVGVAEIGRAGIFALPSSRIRPASTAPSNAGGGGAGGSGPVFDPGIPQLTTWPACGLPAAPGDMLLIADPRDGQLERPSCDGAYDTPTASLSEERNGRQKLVVAIPDMGGIVVIDAQALLDAPAGSFDPCPVERWLPLDVDLTGFDGTPEPPPPAPGAACVNPAQPKPALTPPYTPRPAGITYANGTLYVADLAAPVIHVVDMPTPCDPIERAPLLAYSAQSPKRVVTTSRISVSPAPTPDLRQLLFATDVEDRSIMMFDVGPASTTRLPISRSHPEHNPFQPPDRVAYGAPAADILVVQNDVPATDPSTGLTVSGVRCDPNPALLQCVEGLTTCDVATSYRPNVVDYSTGAGPAKLRGTFALAALTSGRLAVIDVDDLDAPCRGPAFPTPEAGCSQPASTVALQTSLESSCNVVQPGSPRSANFEVANATIGDHVPGVNAYPLLHDINGGLVEFTPEGLRMAAPPGTLHVAGVDTAITGAQHELLMNLEDPRAQTGDQEWQIGFETPIPGFTERLADLRAPLASTGDAPAVYDENSRFCDNGVLGENALREIHAGRLPPILMADGKTVDVAAEDLRWARLADYVQITSELPDELDPHWSKLDERFKKKTPEGLACSLEGAHALTFTECLTRFGTFDAPNAGRDLRIVEAYQDHVEVTQRPPSPLPPDTVFNDATKKELEDLSIVKCCFPSAISFAVRPGSQWLAYGTQSGFLHHVVPDPETGACRNSCDPLLARKNGRILEVPPGATNEADFVFVNPMFRFAILPAKGGPSTTATDRDKYWSFITSGAFTPILSALTSDPSTLIQPQGLQLLAPTGEVAITDGSFNGLIFVSLTSLGVSRTFF